MGETAKSPVMDRKRVILDGAAEILAANGFHGARMAQIAGASGITGPALYRHFAGKDALHAAVIERGIDILEDLVARTASSGTPETVLEATVAGLARVGVEHAPLWLILLRDARYLPDLERERHGRRSDAVVGAVADRLSAARSDLDEREAEFLARSMLVASASPSTSRVRGMNDARRRRLLEDVVGRIAAVRLPARAIGPLGGVPASGPLPPVSRASRREAIINAAHHLFRAQGFHSVSMEDIAVAAGVTGPTVYSYFESKAELLVVAQQRGSAWLSLCLDRAMRTESSPTSRLRVALTSYVDFALDHVDTLAVLVRESCNLPDELLPTVSRDYHDYTYELAVALRSGRHDLEEPVARSIVCAVLDLVSFMSATRRYSAAPDLRACLLALVDAVCAAGAR